MLCICIGQNIKSHKPSVRPASVDKNVTLFMDRSLPNLERLEYLTSLAYTDFSVGISNVDALDRLRVHLNIILLKQLFHQPKRLLLSLLLLRHSHFTVTQLRRGGIFNKHIIENFPQRALVKEFSKSVNIWQRYRQKLGGTLLRTTVYMDKYWELPSNANCISKGRNTTDDVG